MNIQYCKKFAIAIALSGGFVTQAHANSCGDISPLMESLGEEYIALTYSAEDAAKNTGLSEDDFHALIQTSSFSSGKGVRYHCYGTGDNERAVAIEFTLENINKIETARGNVQLKAMEESSRKLAPGVLDLPKASMWQATSKDTYTSSQLFRRANYHGPIMTTQLTQMHPSDLDISERSGSRRVEVTQTIQSSHNTVTLTEAYYYDGHKTNWVTWEIKR